MDHIFWTLKCLNGWSNILVDKEICVQLLFGFYKLFLFLIKIVMESQCRGPEDPLIIVDM